MRPLPASLLTGVAVGALGLGYATGIERHAYALRRFRVPVLAAGSRPLRVLHLSDLHLMPKQAAKQRWVRGLADLEPDVVVNTGDNIAHRDSIPALLDALGELLDLPGVFAFGSNDYFAPVFRNPARYLLPNRSITTPDEQLPHARLRSSLTDRGWLDLTNRRELLEVGGRRIAFAGVDDPHLGYDDLSAVSGDADPTAELTVGVTHAPYLRVLDQFTTDGYRLLLAGHTHGGQLCVPGYGALVTNCDLDRRRVKGLHQHRVPGRPPSWMHVSAGLGTSPYAPARFACRPEATLLTLEEGQG